MTRLPKIRLTIAGELAEALIWEAERRGVDREDLAQRILGESADQIIKLWRESRLSRYAPNGKPSDEEIKATKMVLAKAYGPGRKARRARTRTSASR